MALIRQFAAESLVLAATGAVVALFLARGLSHTLLYALATQCGVPTLILATDWRVLGFATALASATCIIFGIAPALRATHIEAVAAMKSGGRGSTACRSSRPTHL